MITRHELEFETRPWDRNPVWQQFRVGTCHGLYRSAEQVYEILAVVNDKQGNGHFSDVMQWFEHSCRRDGFRLRFAEVWNKEFKKLLTDKYGFQEDADQPSAMIKSWEPESFDPEDFGAVIYENGVEE